jgi:signal transduction histidine kinase
VLRTRQPARKDRYDEESGPIGAHLARVGVHSAVGTPILVEGRVWGAMIANSVTAEPLPAEVEQRISRFTELTATAIANLEAREELAASRRRLAAAGVEERRRVVRDLHDGGQQRLVYTVVTLKLALRALRAGDPAGVALVEEAIEHAERANAELRELANGILPAALRRDGLAAAVEALAARSAVPIVIRADVPRLPPAVETTAYFVVAEALTNVAKHAGAHHAEVAAHVRDGVLALEVRDDGVGGAVPHGRGLVGLADRLTALGGRLRVESPPGAGTRVLAEIPVTEEA